jgi:hypothetical protein
MEASNLHQHWVKKHFLVYKNNFTGVTLHQIKVKLTPLSVFLHLFGVRMEAKIYTNFGVG